MTKKLSDDLVRWIRTTDLPVRALAHQLKRRHGIIYDPSSIAKIKLRKRYPDVPD